VASAVVRLSHSLLGDDTRFQLHGALTSRHWTTILYGGIRPKIRKCIVHDDTDLVIEGFPRSANTYAVAAFRCANGPGPVLADHLHAASSVREGVRRGIPVVVVLRDPVDASVSLIQRQPVRPRTALTAYVRFCTRIRPVLDRVVVSDFTTTTQDFGATLAEVNRRFGTSFSPYEHTEANETWCRDFVIAADRADQGELRESTVALPQASRREQRQPIVDAVVREAALVEDARGWYDELRTASVQPRA
jgi:hypothetical protein